MKKLLRLSIFVPIFLVTSPVVVVLLWLMDISPKEFYEDMLQ